MTASVRINSQPTNATQILVYTLKKNLDATSESVYFYHSLVFSFLPHYVEMDAVDSGLEI